MSGGGGGQVTGFRYYMGLHFGLCHGPLDALLEIRGGDRTAWAGAQTVSGTIFIDSPNLYGGDLKEGGIQGYADVMMGESTQLANPYLTAQQGLPQPAYRGLATLVYKSGEIGANNPYPKPWTFRMRRNTAGWQGGVAWNAAQAAITLSSGVKGQNPAHIIYEALTNSDWGMGYPTATIDDASFLAAAAQLHSEGFGLCVLWNRENSIEQFVQDVINNVCGAVFPDPTTGLFVFNLMRGGYDPSTLPVFTEDNVLEILSYDAPSLIGSVNEMVVTYVDPTIGSQNYGGKQCVAVQALGSIQAQGAVVSQKRDYPHIATADLALRVAQRDLGALSTGLKRLQVRLDRSAWRLVPAGLFRLDFAPLGIASLIFRIGEIDYGTLTNSAITVTAVQDVFSLPASSYVAVPVTGWIPPNANPTAPTLYMGIDADYRNLLRNLPSATFAALAAGEGFALLAVERPSGLAYNYQVWSAVAPSTSYTHYGIGNWTPTAQILAGIGPFDTSIALISPVDLINVVAGTCAYLTDGVNTEVVKVQAIDPVALTATIARGCLDTVCYAFGAGSRLWFLDSIFGGGDGVEYVAAETVDTKPLTVTGRGVLDGSLAPVIATPIIGRQWLPYPPAYLTVDGTRWDLVSGTLTGTLTFAWRQRNRVTQADTLIDQTASTLTPEAGQSYTLNIYDNVTSALLSTAAGLTGTSTTATLSGVATTLRAELFSVRGGYASWQKQVATFAYSNITVPGAPTIGTAVRGNAQASVAFTPPAFTGGSPITSYTATSSPGGFTASGAGSPLVVTGLTNGTPYTFTVTATNAVGTGAPSAASNSVTPATVPGAPTIGTAIGGVLSASVAFTAPGSNGGSTITGYTATSSPGGLTGTGASSPITVSGLTAGIGYTFTVTATNAVGTGAASAASNSVTPIAGYVLDLLSVGASAAYGLRLMRGAYAGNAIKVRRSSDNTTQDIGFSAGALDTTALSAFVGANSGYVDTWYDQSGNGNDATQSTQANQPRIVNAGTIETALGGLPTVRFISANSNQLSIPTAACVAGTSPSSINVVARGASQVNGSGIIGYGHWGTTFPTDFWEARTIFNAPGNLVAAGVYGSGGDAVSSTAWVSTSSVITATWEYTPGYLETIYADGTSAATSAQANTTVLTAANCTFGSIGPAPGVFGDGYISEAVLIASLVTTADRHLLERNQGAYYGITVA